MTARNDIKCERCGTVIHHPTSRQKYCHECAYIAARERDKNNYIKHHDEIFELNKSHRNKKRGFVLYIPKANANLAEIAKAARDVNLSYGKYVGMLYMGYTPTYFP